MEPRKKWISGYEGLYWVTDDGKVISADRYDRFNRKVGGELKQHKAGSGYYFVSLFKDGVGQQRYVHRLVSDAFIPNTENKPCVDHLDNNKENNNVSNLRWVTYKENQNNPITRAKMLEDTSKFASQVGADNPFSRKVRMYSLDGEYIKTFDAISQAASFAGVTGESIRRVCQGERFQSGGYFWAYEGKAKKTITPRVPVEPTNKRKVMQLSIDGSVIAEYESVAIAAEKNGFHACNIVHACRGRLKTYKGYKWRYKE